MSEFAYGPLPALRKASSGSLRLQFHADIDTLGSMRLLAVLLAALTAWACAAHAAAIAQALSPVNVSVAGNESALFSVRFLDAQGRPAVGESVQFSNDVCGRFPNGGFTYGTVTDANGVASARFTAFSQGITCWLVAVDGAQAQFNVLTYLPAYAYLSAALPSRVLAGERFSIGASAMYGAYTLYNADISARIVPGTGSATISPATANSGQSGSVRFSITPTAVGDFDIELTFRDQVQRFPVKLGSAPWQDLWWGGLQENGWGMSVVQHGETLFSAIYAYDAQGKPTWYVMPGGAWNATHTAYSGALYVPHGTPFSAYDASRLVAGAAVGKATLDFSDPANASLSYVIDGVAGGKAIQRELFGAVDLSSGITVGDMWWGGAAQNGWGLAVLQQYRSLFAVWFTYDADGNPTWYVMPSGSWSDSQTWQGRIYRTTSSPWLGQAYDASRLASTDVGPFRLHFSGDTGTFDYTIDGQSGSIPIQRQPF